MCCPICCEDMNNNKADYVRLNCNHDYHFSCIITLLATEEEFNNKCPMCRKEIISERQIKLKSNDVKLCVQEIIRLTDVTIQYKEEINNLTILVVSLTVMLCLIGFLGIYMQEFTSLVTFKQLYDYAIIPLCLSIPMGIIVQNHTGLVVG